MWIIHRGDRKTVYNTDSYDIIRVCSDSIEMVKSGVGEITEVTEILFYENESDAERAFGYMLEALKRKDALVHI